MRKKKLLGTVAALLLVSSSASTALARTIVAGAGRPMIGSEEAHFNAANGIVNNTSPNNKTWVIPLVFDTFGSSKTITVRGRSNIGSGSLSCQAFAYNTAGSIASSSLSTAFTQTAGYTTISLTLSSVPSGSVGSVACVMNNNASLLGVDF
jgi:hypothetical protein